MAEITETLDFDVLLMLNNGIARRSDLGISLRNLRIWYAEDDDDEVDDETEEVDDDDEVDDDTAIPDWVRDPEAAFKVIRELRQENANRRKRNQRQEAKLEKLESRLNDIDEKKLEEENKWKELAEKRKGENEKLEDRIGKITLDAIRRDVALDLGLPPVLVERLQGDDEDSIREDAQKLIDELPEATRKKRKTRKTTVSPGGNTSKETSEERFAQYNSGSFGGDGTPIIDLSKGVGNMQIFGQVSEGDE